MEDSRADGRGNEEARKKLRYSSGISFESRFARWRPTHTCTIAWICGCQCTRSPKVLTAPIITSESRKSMPATAVDLCDSLLVSQGELAEGGLIADATDHIGDKVAPVIRKASVVAGPTGQDTLIVYFSETMNPVTSAAPFLFMHDDGTTFAQLVKGVYLRSDSGYAFVIIGQSRFQPGDRIWINDTARVNDLQIDAGGSRNVQMRSITEADA